MSNKPNLREGSIGALRTDKGEVIFLPAVPAEDHTKQERIKGEEEYFQITDTTLGLVSEALKQKDYVIGGDMREAYLTSFLRGAKKEFGLEFFSSQIKDRPIYLGWIEQIRRSEEVLFMVKVIANIVLTNPQMTHLEKTAGKIEIVQPAQLKQFVEENKARIRPAARLAAQKIYQLEQMEV